MPPYFQFIIESILRSALGDRPLPIIVYMDNRGMYGYTHEQVLEDMLEASNGLPGLVL